MACPGSFHLVMLKNSSQVIDPDKLGCTTSCWGDETDPNFLRTFFLIYDLYNRP